MPRVSLCWWKLHVTLRRTCILLLCRSNWADLWSPACPSLCLHQTQPVPLPCGWLSCVSLEPRPGWNIPKHQWTCIDWFSKCWKIKHIANHVETSPIPEPDSLSSSINALPTSLQTHKGRHLSSSHAGHPSWPACERLVVPWASAECSLPWYLTWPILAWLRATAEWKYPCHCFSCGFICGLTWLHACLVHWLLMQGRSLQGDGGFVCFCFCSVSFYLASVLGCILLGSGYTEWLHSLQERPLWCFLRPLFPHDCLPGRTSDLSDIARWPCHDCERPGPFSVLYFSPICVIC